MRIKKTKRFRKWQKRDIERGKERKRKREREREREREKEREREREQKKKNRKEMEEISTLGIRVRLIKKLI